MEGRFKGILECKYNIKVIEKVKDRLKDTEYKMKMVVVYLISVIRKDKSGENNI